MSNRNASRTAYAVAIVNALQHPGRLLPSGAYAPLEHRRAKHVYYGSVPPAVVAKRRARNKAARAARRINRGRP